MALKPQRYELTTDIYHFMNEVAERGGVVSFGSNAVTNTYTGLGPSGAALDQASALVTYAAGPSGLQPLGVLLNDVVNVDLTLYELNYYKNEVQLGSKVTVLTHGWVVTDMIKPGITPVPGDFAYCAESGYFTNAAHSTNPRGYPLVGRFMSRKDDEGFARVEVNVPLPMVNAKA